MKVWVETTPTQRLRQVFSSKENVQQFWKDVYKDDFCGKKLKVVDGKFGVTPELRLMRVEPYEPVALAYELEVDEYYAEKARKEAEERRKEEERKEREIPDEPLGPCPKCGGKAVVNHPAYDGGACVSCRKCGYSPQRLTWAETDKRAIYNWNHLPKEDAECRDR